jgi:hypothetical protein
VVCVCGVCVVCVWCVCGVCGVCVRAPCCWGPSALGCDFMFPFSWRLCPLPFSIITFVFCDHRGKKWQWREPKGRPRPKRAWKRKEETLRWFWAFPGSCSAGRAMARGQAASTGHGWQAETGVPDPGGWQTSSLQPP